MSADSSQLVKCRVKNKTGQTSFRLIERDYFDLWYYLVSNKHGIQLMDTSLCMWVSAHEFVAKEAIYRRAGTVESANRLMLMVFDETGNFANTVRYVPNEDSDQLESILINHVPDEQRRDNQFTLHKDTGYLVVTGPMQQIKLKQFAATL